MQNQNQHPWGAAAQIVRVERAVAAYTRPGEMQCERFYGLAPMHPDIDTLPGMNTGEDVKTEGYGRFCA